MVLSATLRDTCSSDEGCETVGLCTERDSMKGEWYRGRFRALKIQPERECGVQVCVWGGVDQQWGRVQRSTGNWALE